MANKSRTEEYQNGKLVLFFYVYGSSKIEVRKITRLESLEKQA